MKFISLIGTPYEEKDCWAVVRDFYKLQFDMNLLPYYEEIPEGREDAKDLIYSSMKDFEEVVGPRKMGDIFLIRLYGVESHVAVYLGEEKMLHTSKHTGCIIESISRWSKLIVGTYRVRESNVQYKT